MSRCKNASRWMKLLSLGCLAWGSMVEASFGVLIIGSPQTIVERITLQPIIVSNSDGSNTAAFMGNASQEASIKLMVDQIWAQAGIDIDWLAPNFLNDSFTNIGTPGNNNPRPTLDLNAIVSGTGTPPKSSDPLVLNIFFVEIAAGFSNTSENTANGLAFINGNGITQHVGDNLPGFLGGREVVASVIAHEIGHNMGLPHIQINGDFNLMQEGGSPNPGQMFNAAQIATALASNFSQPVPEPSTWLMATLVGAAGVVAVRRRRRSGHAA